MWQEEFQSQLSYYRSQHRTTGCKVTHLVGVPMIAASIPLLLFSAKAASRFFVAGWALQLIGHYVYEKNKPVLFQEHGNPMVIAAALVFVTENWVKVIKGESLSDSIEIQGNGSDDTIKRIRADL
jgi:uncharacterized membrane protein YGL010W